MTDGSSHDARIVEADSVTAPVDGPALDTQSCGPPLPPSPTLHLFTQLKSDLAAITDPAAREARINSFFGDVEKAGGVPVRDAQTVVFLYRGEVQGQLSVAGTFNGWTPGTDVMAKLPDTDLFYLEKSLGKARHEYKLVTGSSSWFKDPINEHVTWDGIDKPGVGEFNSVIPPYGGVDPDGQLRWLRVQSLQLGNTRDIFVYLPTAYEKEPCLRFPVLLVNDGNESLTRAHFDQVARDTFAASGAKPAILVFVALADQNDRLAEYSCEESGKGPAYTSFLCDTLLPLLDKRYRTLATPSSRGIVGASMGGLIAYAALFWRNDCLQTVGAQSGSFWFADETMIKRVKDSTSKLTITRAYLDNGSDNRASTLAMRDALKAEGYAVHHLEDLQHDHDWAAWKDRFDEALSYLLPP